MGEYSVLGTFGGILEVFIVIVSYMSHREGIRVEHLAYYAAVTEME